MEEGRLIIISSLCAPWRKPCHKRSADLFKQASTTTTLERIEAVSLGPKNEESKANYHGKAWDPKPKLPAYAFLNVVQYRHGDGVASICSKVPPVEERAPGGQFSRVILVELICAKCLDARFVSALTKCHHIEGHVEENHRNRRRILRPAHRL